MQTADETMKQDHSPLASKPLNQITFLRLQPISFKNNI